MDEKTAPVTPQPATPAGPSPTPATPETSPAPAPTTPAPAATPPAAASDAKAAAATEVPVKKSSKKKLFLILFVLVDLVLAAYIAYRVMM
jgi:hypothetical protein